MKAIFKITASGLGVIGLAGLLAGCEKKAEDATATPAAVASSTSSAATDAADATGEAGDAGRRAHEGPGAMSDDMAERHRQDMDHDEMRRGPMGPMGPGATPSPSGSSAAQQPMDHM